MVYRRIVFDVVPRDSATAELRLQIDVLEFRQSYNNGELSKIPWMTGSDNLADSLTMAILTTTFPLYMIMQTDRSHLARLGLVAPRKRKVSGVLMTQSATCLRGGEQGSHD